jgi:hypothetical protein
MSHSLTRSDLIKFVSETDVTGKKKYLNDMFYIGVPVISTFLVYLI